MKTLAQLRRETGLTQIELSKKTGIAVSTIAMYEVGRREPSLKKARQLADFFGVTIADIMFGQSVKEKNQK
jgi:DNA-binding XRE family transcriptional regulator